MTPRIELVDLSCHFGDFRAVDRLSLAIVPGEFVSLLGPSGCGKTTTLRMIAGFITPTSGTIALDGSVISQAGSALPPERRGMSMIFQSYAIWPNMTVAENVAFGLKVRRMDRATVAAKVGRVLDVVRLAALANRYPGELSGGQQQRVALARAVVIEPRVLLLDEPLSNLDANLREEMRSEIRRLHDAYHFTTVYVTHDQAEAMVTSDRIAVMNHGRIEQIDAPYVLYTRPRTRFVAGFIGRTNLVEGRIEGGEVVFDGFRLPVEGFAAEVASGLFSVRPQSIALSGMADAGLVAGEVVERAYLGEYWDYVVAPHGSGARLKVSADPSTVFAIGASVWLRFDARQMQPVE